MSEITLPTPITTSMHARRPDVVSDQIAARFKDAQRIELDNYTKIGTEMNYSFPRGIWGEPEPDWEEFNRYDSAVAMLGRLSDEHRRRQRVLDIGAGFGGFVVSCEQQGHVAHGLTAVDFRKFDPNPSFTQHLNNENYVVGNGDNLMDIPRLLDRYDFIVSQYTFMHMTDPLGAIEQAIQKVAPLGMIAVNKLSVPTERFDCKPDEALELIREAIMRPMVKAGFVFQTFQTHFEFKRRLVTNALVATAPASQQQFSLPLDYIETESGGWGYRLVA